MTLHLENHAHAVVKDSVVINILAFDKHDSSLLDVVLNHFSADEVVCCCNHGIAYINGTWDGTKFWTPQPYPSWIKGKEDWEAPIPYPTDGNLYAWNEDTMNWEEVVE